MTNFLQMLKKGSRVYSILTGTCPRCQCKSMYVGKNPFNLSETLKMHENCASCGFKYSIEPSFFYGAMYVSYGLNVALGIVVFIISHSIFNAVIRDSFVAIIVALIVLMPIVLRLSRNIYINMFISFDKNINGDC